MNQFSIRDIENLCGIKAHTLRIWEQRYDLFRARRKESRHRVYDNEDLKELLRISFLYHNGYKVSRIAGMTREEIQAHIQQTAIRTNNYESFILQLLESGIDFNTSRFREITDHIISDIGISACLKDVFFPLLERIGCLWMTNHVVPAQEHFISHLVQQRIITEITALGSNDWKDKKPVLLFAPEGELHEIPLWVIHYHLVVNAHPVVNLGANVSSDTIRLFLRQRPVRCLFTHLITSLDNGSLEKTLEDLCTEFPENTVHVSGPVGRKIENGVQNMKVLKSYDSFLEVVSRL